MLIGVFGKERVLGHEVDLREARSFVRAKIHLLGSGPLLREALRAQEILAEKYGVSVEMGEIHDGIAPRGIVDELDRARVVRHG